MIPLPESFCERIKNQFSVEGNALLESLNTSAITSIRLNKFKEYNHPFDDRIPWNEDGYYLAQRPLFTADPYFHAGAYYVQEASSMIIAAIFKKLFDPEEPIKAVDLCAAPGGKSTLLMSLLNKNSYLVSNEFVALRASILQENIIKWGLGNAFITNNAVAHFGKLKHHFDLMLLDAPCSGEGLFRKDEDARQEWSEQNCDLCVSRQEKIIYEGWECLKIGGYFLYATCTFNAEENERLLARMQPNLEAETVKIDFPESWGITSVQSGNIIGYQFFPHKTKGEGFFIAVLKKNGARKKNIPKTLHPKKGIEKPIEEIIGNNYDVVKFKEQWHAVNSAMYEDFPLINKCMNLKYVGTEIGEIINKKLIPAHSLAMSPFLNLAIFERIEVDESQAILYLSRKEFNIQSDSLGWKLICFKGMPIGFIKHLGNRWNNYYPQQWRIRMDIKLP